MNNLTIYYYFCFIVLLIAIIRHVVYYPHDWELSAPPHSAGHVPAVRAGVVAEDLFAETVFTNHINQVVQKDGGHFMHRRRQGRHEGPGRLNIDLCGVQRNVCRPVPLPPPSNQQRLVTSLLNKIMQNIDCQLTVSPLAV